MQVSYIGQFFPVIPEIFITCMALFLLVVGVVRGDAFVTFINKSVILVLLLTLILVTQLWGGEYMALEDMFRTDGYAVMVKSIILISAVAVLMMIFDLSRATNCRAEHSILVLFSVIGMMVMVSANDIIVLYVGLELQSLSLYVLASIDRDSNKSSEAGLKYFVLGALASGFLLYGASLIYGFTGTTNFDTLASLFGPGSGEKASLGVIVGMVMLVIGLCFKVSAVPFHMWTPDVYEGAPTPVTAFFAAVPKIAAMALFIRVMIHPLGGMVDQWQQIIIFVSIVSMLVGSFGALKQTNIKRLMAYSSIGHVGYMLVGMAAGGVDGVQAMLLYMAIYVTMTVGIFSCILCMKRRGEPLRKISDFAGLAKSHPLFALAIAVLMFSLAGIPPMAGFFGKFMVFKAALGSGLYMLAVIGVLTSVVAAFYYIRIIKLMYFDDSKDDIDEELLPELKFLILVTSLFNVLFVVSPSTLFELTKIAASTLFL